MAENHIRRSRQPARARQVEKNIRRQVVARHHVARPPSGVFRARWGSLGSVLCCYTCSHLLGGTPVVDARFDFVKNECFVCSAPITNSLRQAA